MGHFHRGRSGPRARAHADSRFDDGRAPKARYSYHAKAMGPRIASGQKAEGNQARPVDLKMIARKAMNKYGFECSFPPNVMSQANALDNGVLGRESRGACDLRNLLWSSIDNSDTMDLDQIEYCEQGQDGEIHVKVAIADVDAFVPKGSAADMHARKNTTSVYTGIETFPMLPDRLSKNLSSLPPGEDRLAMVVEFAVRQNGEVKPGQICRAIVRNRAKLVYEEVGAWLEGTGPMPQLIANDKALEAQLRLQNSASLRLAKYRMERGALELESLEARAVFDHEKVMGLVVMEENLARRIIENFMIGANGVMSGYLERANIPTIQRVVRVPKDWKEIVLLARKRGTHLPHSPSAKALSLFLAKERAADLLRFPDLSLAIVKLIGNGEYVMFDKRKPIGHFCLAVTSYTHGTAPNRRYVDLIIQRLLKAALKREHSPYGKKELDQAAFACTEREHAAKKVERFMTKAEAAVLLQGKIGQTFDALITGASEKGIYARLLAPPVEGRLVRFAKGLKIGQEVRVTLVNLDPQNGFVDFDITR